MQHRTVTLIAALICVCAGRALAESETVSFKHITMQDGLSSNTINSTYRDGLGFVWISTDCGLNRYDGYSIKTFIPGSAASAKAGKRCSVGRVWDIDGDKLLVSANRSFFIFDKRTEVFSDASQVFGGRGLSPLTSVVTVDKRHRVWVASGGTCSIYSSDDTGARESKVEGFSKAKITSFDQRGDKMYAAHSDGQISIFSQSGTGDWRLEKGVDGPKETDERHYDIFTDSMGDIWLIPGDSYGLWFWPGSSGVWKKCSDATPPPMRMPSFMIHSIAEDSEGRIWVASNHGGINIIDLRAGRCTEIRSRKNSSRTILSNSISNLYSDDQGCIWVGDVRLGVSVFGEPIYKFGFDNLETGTTPPDFAAQVNCIAEDSDGNIWYGTNDNGLLLTRIRTGEHQVFTHSGENSLPSDIVVSLCPDADGGMWVGTFLGGMCHYDGRRFTRFHKAPEIPKAAASDNIWSISMDSRDRLWVGSLGQGAAMFDKNSGKWASWTTEEGLPSDFVTKVIPMSDGKIAIGTSEGLCYLSFSDTANEIEKDTILRNGANIVDLRYDSRGLLWACTSAGLHVIDGRTGRHLGSINTTNGLSSDATLGISEDRRHVMWVTTTHGISSIDISHDGNKGSISFRVYNYSDQDGTIVGSINERATICTADGEIIIGRANGVDRFRPEDIKYNSEKPLVTFTSLSTFGEETPIGAAADGGFSLDEALTYCQEIELPYDVNMFTVYFSTLSTILPEKVTYEYKLDGFNNSWIKTTENQATYTNLSPGEYMLMVRAANCDGIESEEASALRIRILPPWWMSPAAYAAYVLIVIGAIMLSVKWVRDRYRAKFRLRQMMADIEHERKVDDMKLRFFTNVSHELRTPLSLIVSPIENILSKMPSQSPDRGQIELIHRNSLKLLNMVNQLLDFRKTDIGGMTLNLSEGDFAGYIEQCCKAYCALDKKDIKFSFRKEAKNILIKFDKDKIGKIITNLLSNAYKFTPVGGQVRATVGLTEDKARAYVSVSDTGIGISDEHKKHIFERFYQVPQTDSSFAGSGIGLNLVKDFAEMHGGSVSVSDNEGGGTVFRVEIPVPQVVTQSDSDNDEANPLKETEKGGSGGKLIAIVDDNPDFISLLQDTLRDEYDTVEAHNGQEAFSVIEKALPDLIITDVMMPVMDGNELCKKVKNDIRTSHIPLIMLTAKAAEEHNIEGLKSGADDYLTKPFNPQILRLKVKRLIEQGEKRKQAFKSQIEPEPSQITITTLDEQLIKKAIDYVETNIASPALSVEDLSRHLGMSRVHLYKKLTTITGRSPIEFIRILRLKRAAQMLKDPSQNVSDVAYSVGFNNPKYFTKYFKEEFGVLPSKYYLQQDDEKTKNDSNIANDNSKKAETE